MIDPALHTLFVGSVAVGVTKFVPVPVRFGHIGVDIGWLDATSNATITLELTSTQADVFAAGNAWEWKASGVAVTGPVAAAAGGSFVNIENVRQQRARLRILGVAATSNFDIRDGTSGTESGGLP